MLHHTSLLCGLAMLGLAASQACDCTAPDFQTVLDIAAACIPCLSVTATGCNACCDVVTPAADDPCTTSYLNDPTYAVVAPFIDNLMTTCNTQLNTECDTFETPVCHNEAFVDIYLATSWSAHMLKMGIACGVDCLGSRCKECTDSLYDSFYLPEPNLHDKECWDCLGDLVQCTAQHCALQCICRITDSCSAGDGCDLCTVDNCNDRFQQCAGASFPGADVGASCKGMGWQALAADPAFETTLNEMLYKCEIPCLQSGVECSTCLDTLQIMEDISLGSACGTCFSEAVSCHAICDPVYSCPCLTTESCQADDVCAVCINKDCRSDFHDCSWTAFPGEVVCDGESWVDTLHSFKGDDGFQATVFNATRDGCSMKCTLSREECRDCLIANPNVAAYGLEAKCSNCVAAHHRCLMSQCSAACLTNNATSCDECQQSYCNETFALCSGIEVAYNELHFQVCTSYREPPKSEDGGGFVFEGCDGGSGTFSVTLDEKGKSFQIGDIPRDQLDLKVYLTANNDLDIRLFDLEDTCTYPEGQAIVAWCEPPCNRGFDNGSQTAVEFDYKNMSISYSGYDGEGKWTTGPAAGKKKKGFEHILVDGHTTSVVGMRAFAYETGEVEVNYEWKATVSGCCMGTHKCGGDFTTSVAKGEYIVVGEIPAGKIDLEIKLTAEEDVDVQLYDLGDVRSFDQGQAIIAYCAPKETNCNMGLLGNKKDAEEAVYNELIYSYSGYDGTDGKKGNEYIRISGTTNTPLQMQAYGYKAGSFDVAYTYYNPVPERN